MRDRTNLRIGEVEVYFNETYLGYTKGGVEFTFEREFEDLTVDEYGTTPLDMALTGHNLQIKAMLAEITTANLANAVPEGTYAFAGSDSKLGLGNKAGHLMSGEEGLLRLHPRKNAGSNRNEDIYIWKAVSVESLEMAFKVDEQRVFEVTWRALVDDSMPDGAKLGSIGDVAIS